MNVPILDQLAISRETQLLSELLALSERIVADYQTEGIATTVFMPQGRLQEQGLDPTDL